MITFDMSFYNMSFFDYMLIGCFISPLVIFIFWHITSSSHDIIYNNNIKMPNETRLYFQNLEGNFLNEKLEKTINVEAINIYDGNENNNGGCQNIIDIEIDKLPKNTKKIRILY